MAQKPSNLIMSLIPLLLLLFFFSLSAIANAHNHSSVFDFIKELQGCHKGNKSQGIHRLKTYLREFGYLNKTLAAADDTTFDNALESAVKTYQQNFHIKPTGVLDPTTVSTMMAPRCGVPDIINGTNYMAQSRQNVPSSNFHIVAHYTFFPGNPRWPASKRQLTYRFLSGFPSAAMDPVRRAFQKWASATQYFAFAEVQPSQISDLTVGFYRGDHGDNAPFDGPGGTLAHAYSPTNGRFHYDADERWSVGAVPNYFDLETVAVHEIGHLLGLGHSQVSDAIMFPSISPGRTKNIHPDDVQGIKVLYNY